VWFALQSSPLSSILLEAALLVFVHGAEFDFAPPDARALAVRVIQNSLI
jgi:hypothetical protein